MKSIYEYVMESSDPYKEEQKILQKGKKLWDKAVEKANKEYQKLYNRNVDDNVWGDEIWGVINKMYGPSDYIKIYHWLDYTRKDGKYRYESVENYLRGEKLGKCSSIK